MAKADEVVRRLGSGQGGRMMTIDEAALVDRLKAVAGDRHPAMVLSLLEDWNKRLGGMADLERAVRHYEASGLHNVDRVLIKIARNKFLDQYDDSPWETMGGLRKEIDAFVVKYSPIEVGEITREMLLAWVSRARRDGNPPAPRYFNNRLSTWLTFFNRCREWNYLPKGEKHAAEQIKKQEEPKGAVPIFTVAEAEMILGWIMTHKDSKVRRLRVYFVIGCWLGLRPFEIRRIEWRHFDWQRNYLHVDEKVAMKTEEARFVPIPPKARSLLESWLREAGLWALVQTPEHLDKQQRKCCFGKDGAELAARLRKVKLITVWPQDIMRHSYISYQIAVGHGKGQVAEWAGNSEAVIRKRYRRPLMKEDGEAWFKLTAERS